MMSYTFDLIVFFRVKMAVFASARRIVYGVRQFNLFTNAHGGGGCMCQYYYTNVLTWFLHLVLIIVLLGSNKEMSSASNQSSNL